jgi:ABC-type methionine transport system permease subunit
MIATVVVLVALVQAIQWVGQAISVAVDRKR